jgi:hypothetical protein
MTRPFQICRMILRGYQQFANTDLDFTHPLTGEPANRICLIGRNGTGKTTVLQVLSRQLSFGFRDPRAVGLLCAFELKVGSRRVYVVRSGAAMVGQCIACFRADLSSRPGWADEMAAALDGVGALTDFRLDPADEAALLDELQLRAGGTDLLIDARCESNTNSALGIADVPQTTVSDALGLFKEFPFYHEVSNQTVSQMWRVLVYLLKKRDNDRENFENLAENLSKTKRQLIDEFDAVQPKPLHQLAKVWNRILGQAGLELDETGANNPIQLNDNLHAYIRLIESKQRIPYNKLSTGMRDFLFRLGHIYLLFLGGCVERGFLLVDEPENSLFPDFLYNLIDDYGKATQGPGGHETTQMFFATHSPIIAAQFEPWARIFLDWDGTGHVVARKGHAPIGDDPNDLLTKDFELPNLMAKEGLAKWAEYLELRKRLRRASDPQEKDALLEQAMALAASYDFSGASER